jgi:hypothetical protein
MTLAPRTALLAALARAPAARSSASRAAELGTKKNPVPRRGATRGEERELKEIVGA